MWINYIPCGLFCARRCRLRITGCAGGVNIFSHTDRLQNFTWLQAFPKFSRHVQFGSTSKIGPQNRCKTITTVNFSIFCLLKRASVSVNDAGYYCQREGTTCIPPRRIAFVRLGTCKGHFYSSIILELSNFMGKCASSQIPVRTMAEGGKYCR